MLQKRKGKLKGEQRALGISDRGRLTGATDDSAKGMEHGQVLVGEQLRHMEHQRTLQKFLTSDQFLYKPMINFLQIQQKIYWLIVKNFEMIKILLA